MATYYVTQAGNDINTGSIGAPWLTIQKAASTMVAGDTVFVSSGNYVERINVTVNGTSGAPITFTVDTSGGAVTLGGIFARGAYQNYSGFTLSGTGVPDFQSNIYLSATASNCSFSNMTSTGIPANTTQLAGAIGMTAPGPNNCTFDNITITNPNANWITLFGNGHIVSNCTMSSTNGWDAIRILGSNQIIRGNTIRHSNPLRNVLGHPDFFQSFATGAPGPIQNNLIENNICIGGNDTDPDDDVQLGNMEDQGETGIVGNFTFRNNLFINVSRTINVYPDGFKFYNNTFYRCAGYYGATSPSNFPIIYDNAGTKGKANNLEIINNIFFECGTASSATKGWYAGRAGTGLIANYNLVVGIGAGTTKTGFRTAGQEVNGINGLVPLFTNADGVDFSLLPNSPAIGTGMPLNGQFTLDINGAVRGSAWDIGAYAYLQLVLKRFGRHLKFKGLAPV